METRVPCCFDAVVVTSPTERSASAMRGELDVAFSRSCVAYENDDTHPPPLLLTCADPFGRRVGSGGGTINAMDEAVRALGRPGEDADAVMARVRVLIIHSGGDSQRSPMQSVCGKAWCSVNATRHHKKGHPVRESLGAPTTPIELLLGAMCRAVSPEAIPLGSVVVACSDVLLLLPDDFALTFASDTDGALSDVVGLAISSSASYGPKHGVFVCPAGGGKVTSYLQKASMDELSAHGALDPERGTVLVDSGVILMNARVSRHLLRLASASGGPLAGLTWGGARAGAPPLRIELYSDILLAVGGVGGHDSFEAYLGALGVDRAMDVDVAARRGLWAALAPCTMSACVPVTGSFGHLGTTREQCGMLHGDLAAFRTAYALQPRVLVAIDDAVAPRVSESAVVMNSWLQESSVGGLGWEGGVVVGKGATIEHSVLGGAWCVGANAFVSNLRRAHQHARHARALPPNSLPDPQPSQPLPPSAWARLATQVLLAGPGSGTVVPPNKCLQEVSLDATRLREAFPDSITTEAPFVLIALGVDDGIKQVFHHHHCHHEGLEEGKAARFCDVPWTEFLGAATNLTAEDVWPAESRRDVWNAKVFPVCEDTALGQGGGAAADMMEVALWPLYASEGRWPAAPVVEAWKRSIRLSLKDILRLSDPEAQFRWKHALEKDIGRQIVQHAMVELVAPQTATATEFIRRDMAAATTTATSQQRRLRRVTVRAPARIDLAGGWSDTSPISYEHELGGAVTNIAVSVDGELPLEATAELTRETHGITLCQLDQRSGGASRSGGGGASVTLHHMSDVLDYTDPSKPFCLAKAAVVCSGLLRAVGDGSTTAAAVGDLQGQLDARFGPGVGVKLTTQSRLPRGSGMGGSSILAGALLRALGVLMDQDFSDDASLVHAVLQLEQMMTTGGGWQDQVGGCVAGGAKIGRSTAGLPLQVRTQVVPMQDGARQRLQDHVGLIFTGQQRIAKDLLVDVLHRWWSGGGDVRGVVRELVATAEGCAEALEHGDLEAVGAALRTYHGHKRAMAGEGYVPTHIAEMLAQLEPLVHGAALCGAGGGGFLAFVSRRSLAPGGGIGGDTEGLCAVEAVLAEGCTLHRVGVVEGGMEVVVVEEESAG